MKYIKKLNKKYGMLPLIIGISILFKILEWIGQYFFLGNLNHLSNFVWFYQLFFISMFSSLLYIIFDFFNLKKKIFWLIPTMAYFFKELWNLIFVYKAFSLPVIIGLIFEPLLLLQLNKWLVKDVRKN